MLPVDIGDGDPAASGGVSRDRLDCTLSRRVIEANTYVRSVMQQRRRDHLVTSGLNPAAVSAEPSVRSRCCAAKASVDRAAPMREQRTCVARLRKGACALLVSAAEVRAARRAVFRAGAAHPASGSDGCRGVPVLAE